MVIRKDDADGDNVTGPELPCPVEESAGTCSHLPLLMYSARAVCGRWTVCMEEGHRGGSGCILPELSAVGGPFVWRRDTGAGQYAFRPSCLRSVGRLYGGGTLGRVRMYSARAVCGRWTVYMEEGHWGGSGCIPPELSAVGGPFVWRRDTGAGQYVFCPSCLRSVDRLYGGGTLGRVRINGKPTGNAWRGRVSHYTPIMDKCAKHYGNIVSCRHGRPVCLGNETVSNVRFLATPGMCEGSGQTAHVKPGG